MSKLAVTDPLNPNIFTPRKLVKIKLKRSIKGKMSPKMSYWSGDSGGLEEKSCG